MMGIWANIASGMRDVSPRLEAFRGDEEGATSIEYSLIVALIFLAIVSAIRAYTATTSGMYMDISDAMSDAAE